MRRWLGARGRVRRNGSLTWSREEPSNDSNRAIEHATECRTIDDSGINAKSDNSPSVLIHHDQNPIGKADSAITDLTPPAPAKRTSMERTWAIRRMRSCIPDLTRRRIGLSSGAN